MGSKPERKILQSLMKHLRSELQAALKILRIQLNAVKALADSTQNMNRVDHVITLLIEKQHHLSKSRRQQVGVFDRRVLQLGLR